MNSKKFILGIFKEEDLMIKAIKKIREKEIKIEEVFMPYPVHGIEDIAGLHKTRLMGAAVLFGIFGTALVFYFLYWVTVESYPLIYGGKPLYTLPSHVVITFVLMINITSGLSVISFFIANKFYPGKKADLIHPGVVDDTFVVAINKPEAEDEVQIIMNIFSTNGATEVTEKFVK
ncbi:MAG: hypothetical protein CO118_05710 [Flavobacteriales bacterium CG_4_9_14_3_um_filter_32_8]|nr:MAG: hypothetical protein CO118_05710 [Flavobacteriales bacterium CG_4_9_14_3_um_filter_32_8]